MNLKFVYHSAKCVIGANNAIIPTYTAMQYPTVVRNFGVGMGNLAAGVALILVPYMWLLVCKRSYVRVYLYTYNTTTFSGAH